MAMIESAELEAMRACRVLPHALTAARVISSRGSCPKAGRMCWRSSESYFAAVVGATVWSAAQVSVHC